MTNKPNRIASDPKAWLLAVRPKTLPAAVSPVLVGTALAVVDGHFHPSAAGAALAVALFLQIGVNLANDYFDFKKGIDTAERLGPVRVTQSGLIPPASVKRAMVATLLAAAVFGGYLAWIGGWPILGLGVIAILSALAYSGGPFPLASNGMGDLFVFVFFGPVAVGGTYFVQAMRLDGRVLLLSLPAGFLITAILVVNNLRDIDTDARTGKRTLAVMLGEKGARFEYGLLLAAAGLVPVISAAVGRLSPFVLLSLLSFPAALSTIQLVFRRQGRILNQALAGTARLTLVYCLLLSAGLLLGGR